MNTKTSSRLFALASVAAFALAACGGAPAAPTAAPAAKPAETKPTEAPKAAAPKPDKLTVLCTPQEAWCQAQTKAFEAKTGIKTTYVRLSSGEALAKVRATKNNPEYSVWWGGPADSFVAAKIEGLLENYKAPNYAVIPAQQKDADGAWTGVYVGALGFCSNKAELAKIGMNVPDSWEALLDPKLKGKFSIAHPATSGTAYTTVWTQVTLRGGQDQALDYLKKLHQNVFQYVKTGAGPAQTVGRGEAAVGIVFSHDCVATAEEGFKDLVVSFPKEGTGYEIGAMGILKGAPEMEAAKIWVDWALSKEAQELGPTAKAYQLPTNPDAKVSERSVKLSEVKLVTYDFDAAGKARKDLTAKFEEQIAAAPK